MTRCSEAFAKMGSYAAEELELALAAESAGGVRPSTPTIDMMKHAEEALEYIEKHGAQSAATSVYRYCPYCYDKHRLIYR